VNVINSTNSCTGAGNYFAPDRAAKYCDERVCLSLCLCLSAIISSELHVRALPKFSVYVTYGRSSVLGKVK